MTWDGYRTLWLLMLDVQLDVGSAIAAIAALVTAIAALVHSRGTRERSNGSE